MTSETHALLRQVKSQHHKILKLDTTTQCLDPIIQGHFSMARTNQTAKKTTGGMGPRQQLAQKCRNLPTMMVAKAAGTAKQRLTRKAKAWRSSTTNATFR
ncbi:hypothetical protein PAXRUDRAFT_21957 [Paxillus rubicundulus Ve08.2h10]|uniref:Uncharacterized protein n=1 Tax=Paxillus rubicundulus Ve08.2h10 TaxID=930991 RepID=A0A0D0CYH3_9AGAM|nr:hypothetical protein PAXRUDRAFT_21957 [Paxillus rubicundulus Ve08.2h10]